MAAFIREAIERELTRREAHDGREYQIAGIDNGVYATVEATSPNGPLYGSLGNHAYKTQAHSRIFHRLRLRRRQAFADFLRATCGVERSLRVGRRPTDRGDTNEPVIAHAYLGTVSDRFFWH